VTLDGIKANVVKVHVDGVGRTSEDLVSIIYFFFVTDSSCSFLSSQLSLV